MRSLCVVAYSEYPSDARVMRLAEAASGGGYAVDVIALADRDERSKERAGGVTLHRVGTRRYRGGSRALYLVSYMDFFIRCLFRVSWLHLRRRYDIVHVCNMPDFLVFTAVLAKIMGAKVLLDIHDPMPEMCLTKFSGSKRRRLHRWALLQERLSAAFADRVITVSEPVKDDILVAHGMDRGKISVITNFPDEEIFQARERYDIGFPIRMIYYGTIAPRFDLPGILSALACVRHKDKIVFRIIGKGSAEVCLRETIRSMSLDGLVEWDNTVIPLRALPDIVCRYHLGIVPYRPSPATDYMLPVKLMELLALGIPSLTIGNAAIRYYFDESLYFPYNPNDMSTLTHIIDGLIDNPSLLTEKRRIIQRAPKDHSWKEERGKYLDLLARLSNRGGS